MATQHYIGLDIASESFTAAIGTAPWQLLTAPQEFRQQSGWLPSATDLVGDAGRGPRERSAMHGSDRCVR